VAGEFNGWDTQSLPMKKQREGNWKAEIKVPPGRYEYKYLVDGAWIEDLPGVEKAANQYGTQNFVIQVV
jgi:1,4-alpha-glucan branching enzyme